MCVEGLLWEQKPLEAIDYMLCMYVYVCICMCMCVYVCVCVYMYVCVCICMCVCVCVCVCVGLIGLLLCAWCMASRIRAEFFLCPNSK